MPYKYNYTLKREHTSAKGWIDEDTWELIPRTSDVVSALQCDWKSYQNDVNRKKRGETIRNVSGTNLYAIRGTIAHNQIEEWINDQMGLETPPLQLSKLEEKSLSKHEKAGTSEYTQLIDEVSTAVYNFIDWWDMYNPKPISSEQEIVHINYKQNGRVDPTRSLKGTIDFIGEFDLDTMSKNVIKELRTVQISPRKTTTLDIVHDHFISAVDWKTGTVALPSHNMQLVGYDYLLTESKYFDSIKKLWKDGKQPPLFELSNDVGVQNRHSMCVKFGGKSYKNTVYNVENKREFFRAWDRFNNPTKSTYSLNSDRLGKFKMFVCAMCELRDVDCPLFEFNSYEVLNTME